MATKRATKDRYAEIAKEIDAQDDPREIGEPEIFDELEQGSDEWFDIRRGIPTASNFHKIMAQSVEQKGRRDYLYDLAGEIVSGVLAENYRNAAMDRGNVMEEAIREKYAATSFGALRRVGFVRRRLPSGRFVGCSPDALIDDYGVLEIKSMLPRLLTPYVLGEKVDFPPEHKWQCVGAMWVTGRKWVDLRIGYANFPTATFRLNRIEADVQRLSNAVEVFDFDLDRIVRELRKRS